MEIMADLSKSLLKVILLVLTVKYFTTLSAAQCPSGCECTEYNTLMTCKGLAALPSAIPNTTKDVILTDCMLNTLSIVSESYANVLQLVISASEVTNINEGAFVKMTKLTSLTIINNPIETLSRFMFSGLKSLKSLDFSDNAISVIPSEMLKEVPSLEKLTLSNNVPLTFHSDAFLHSKIKKLIVKNCGLNDVPSNIFEKASEIQMLDLGENPLSELKENTFRPFIHLKMLNLQRCSLQTIHKDAFEDLGNLQQLNLANNKLLHLDEDVFENLEESLETLYVQHNLLSTLNHEFADFEKLKVIGLAGNPWNCDCELAWTTLIDFYIDDGENVTCSTPSNLAGSELRNATASMNCPCEYYGNCSGKNIALYIVIPILIVCFVLIAFFIYKIFQHKKQEKQRSKSMKYSEVYRETTEDVNA